MLSKRYESTEVDRNLIQIRNAKLTGAIVSHILYSILILYSWSGRGRMESWKNVALDAQGSQNFFSRERPLEEGDKTLTGNLQKPQGLLSLFFLIFSYWVCSVAKSLHIVS